MRIADVVSRLSKTFEFAGLTKEPAVPQDGTPTQILRALTGDKRWEIQEPIRARWFTQLTVQRGDPASFAIMYALAALPGHQASQQPDIKNPSKFIDVVGKPKDQKPEVQAWMTPYVVSEPDRSVWHYASGAHKRRSYETQVRIAAVDHGKLLGDHFDLMQQRYQEGYRLARSGTTLAAALGARPA